jgi:hypothetical protein
LNWKIRLRTAEHVAYPSPSACFFQWFKDKVKVKRYKDEVHSLGGINVTDAGPQK